MQMVLDWLGMLWAKHLTAVAPLSLSGTSLAPVSPQPSVALNPS